MTANERAARNLYNAIERDWQPARDLIAERDAAIRRMNAAPAASRTAREEHGLMTVLTARIERIKARQSKRAARAATIWAHDAA